jgi:hypothetical protein
VQIKRGQSLALLNFPPRLTLAASIPRGRPSTADAVIGIRRGQSAHRRLIQRRSSRGHQRPNRAWKNHLYALPISRGGAPAGQFRVRLHP